MIELLNILIIQLNFIIFGKTSINNDYIFTITKYKAKVIYTI